MEEDIHLSRYDGPMRCDCCERRMTYLGEHVHGRIPGVCVQTWVCPEDGATKTLNYRYK